MPGQEAATLTLPTFIPLPEAARKYDVSETLLTRLIQDGRINAARLPSGDILVSDNGGDLSSIKTKEQIISEEFAHLRGKRITVSEAAVSYKIPRRNILGWVQYGFIGVIRPGYRMELDEADVAYCAQIYRKHKDGHASVVGIRLFDRDGNPYQLKHPELAEKRRNNSRSTQFGYRVLHT